MAKKGGFNKKELTRTTIILSENIQKLNSNIDRIGKNLETMQNGSASKGPIWNGERAYVWMKNALANYDHLIQLSGKLTKVNEGLKKASNGAKNK